MATRVGHLVIGPPTHGVVRYALAVHAALTESGESPPLAVVATATAVPDALADCALIHLHVTDRLFGVSATEALDNLRALAGTHGGRLSMTLHDIPQPSDGTVLDRRARFYRGALELADGVIVSSEHEARLLRNHVDSTASVHVVPLMIDAPRERPRPRTVTSHSVGVLGFLYPGKGHLETLHAMADLPAEVEFVALGTPSTGHEDLLDELRSVATEQGRHCEVTGFLPDEELHRRMASITVPVAYHRHMSASGSINTWISARRRPLVPRTDYIEEFAARTPGSVTIHEDGPTALQAAIAAALDNPPSTWIDDSVRPVPSPADVAAEYRRLYAGWCA